ncbi:hypothetical protein BC826DRAFT_328820 [Russula brevipes]|nr:hypothetical protein BC826DRAFT_328820 [Russula brevipes]
MPTLPQGRLLVLWFSLCLSCVVMGVSISLLHAPQPGLSLQDHDPNQFGPDPHWARTHSPRDISHRSSFDATGFRNVQILGTVSSALNMLLTITLLVASTFKRKTTIISAVAVEAPSIYIVSFMWLATGAYAADKVEAGPGYYPFLDVHACVRYKVLEGIAFVNWIQLMLYANTLMTVATICHVRRRSVWFLPVTKLPRFSAPALTFGPRPDMEFESPFLTKSNEAETSTLGASNQPIESRSPSHFQSRLPFIIHPPTPPGISVVPSQSLPTGSVISLTPSVSIQSDVVTQNSASHPQPIAHQITTRGEPPTYTAPGSPYIAV